MLKTKRRRLYFDIEVSANVGLFWQSGYKLQIGTENVFALNSDNQLYFTNSMDPKGWIAVLNPYNIVKF